MKIITKERNISFDEYINDTKEVIKEQIYALKMELSNIDNFIDDSKVRYDVLKIIDKSRSQTDGDSIFKIIRKFFKEIGGI